MKRHQSLIQDAIAAFTDHFNQSPTFGAIAPGRINLIGEHTDYNNGFVMPLAIDRYTVVLARPTSATHSTIWARDLNQTETVDIAQPLKPIGGSFADYTLAVIEQFKQRSVRIPNLNLLVTGNIPRGCGLSSSASLEVAVAIVLQQALGLSLTPRDIALLCQSAEQDFVGVPCGIMDMFIIALASADSAMLLDCRSLEFDTVPFPSADDTALLVIDTGVERALRSGEYAQRRNTCSSAAHKLGLPSLRDATPQIINNAHTLDSDERRKALHVVNENARVLAAAAALRTNDMASLGDLMFTSHASLRDLYNVSIVELDVIVNAAASLRARGIGVFGARMTGAGFGGCAIVLCSVDAIEHISTTLTDEFQQHFNRPPTIFRALPAGGASPINL